MNAPDPAALAALLGAAADAATVAYLRPRLAEAGVDDPHRYRLTVVIDVDPAALPRIPPPPAESGPAP
jgi:hypothetical protein